MDSKEKHAPQRGKIQHLHIEDPPIDPLSSDEHKETHQKVQVLVLLLKRGMIEVENCLPNRNHPLVHLFLLGYLSFQYPMISSPRTPHDIERLMMSQPQPTTYHSLI